MQEHVKNHINYLGGLKPQTGNTQPQFWLHQFVKAIVLAYIESFGEDPHYSRDATDLTFVYLVHELADSADLSPPKKSTSMEKYITPAIKAVRADLPDIK